jgi:hypothetical protein
VLGFVILVLMRPVGELVVNSTIVFPGQPTWAITVSLVRLPNQNIKWVSFVFKKGWFEFDYHRKYSTAKLLSFSCFWIFLIFVWLRNSSIMTICNLSILL